MASLVSTRSNIRSAPAAAKRASRSPVVTVKAFTSGSNGKQSIDEINGLIGQRIKEAAAQIGTFRVWQANAIIGKYVSQAAEEAATGKLKPKKAKR
eukprot:gene13268-13399_t